MPFNYYEKFHIHDYVDKKGTSYTKAITDGKINDLKNKIDNEITTLETEIDNKLAALKTEIINFIPSNDPVDPAIAENAMKELVQTIVQKSLKTFNNNFKKMINKRMKGRVGKKSIQIPKTNYTWKKLLSASEINGITSLDEILIQDLYIKRTDRYHNAKSSHTANAFTNLEFFYDANRENYYCYFDNHPSEWNMHCFFNYVRLPTPLKIESEEEE